jgi:hypothetical protein
VNDVLSKTLEQVRLERSVSHRPLHLFPLMGGMASAEESVELF